jgi:hypothetical protein
VKHRGKLRRHDPETRAQLAFRFRAMYRSLGLDLEGCAKLLHVTERTLHNWQSGKHDIPYSAYRLLRLLNRMELPGASWSGWCFHGGKLWSPEGRSFEGTDSAWWSLLVRRAACFDTLFKRSGQFEQALMAMAAERRTTEGPDAARGDAGGCVAPRAAAGEAVSSPAHAGGRREAPALDLSIEHISTHGGLFGGNPPKQSLPCYQFKLAAANHGQIRGAA